MDSEIIVRLARPKDAAAIADFNIAMAMETEQKTLPPDLVARGVAELFDKPSYGFYVVAETPDTVVAGLMITYEWSDWRCGLFWWIQSVYVRPQYRQQRVFTKMYAFLKQQALEHGGVCGFRLYVENSNAVAQSTYQKLGLHEIYYRVYEQPFT